MSRLLRGLPAHHDHDCGTRRIGHAGFDGVVSAIKGDGFGRTPPACAPGAPCDRDAAPSGIRRRSPKVRSRAMSVMGVVTRLRQAHALTDDARRAAVVAAEVIMTAQTSLTPPRSDRNSPVSRRHDTARLPWGGGRHRALFGPARPSSTPAVAPSPDTASRVTPYSACPTGPPRHLRRSAMAPARPRRGGSTGVGGTAREPTNVNRFAGAGLPTTASPTSDPASSTTGVRLPTGSRPVHSRGRTPTEPDEGLVGAVSRSPS
ncbi:hypothetical protein FHR81_003699 [Actinoalloteichus hoggarensis]|uniref:Uncharacterized protein n=1 Tax=Actinoalloteichus hoggarensis TaxID=1470176 RepID=A0A221WCP0_9PSEU|nr:hypothetical protein AHOG_27195 [Actinoalloteichus hoggarensis]MBB5922642.1 hypothetical protein [Actinoalloteichus hoggarensis]